MHKIADPVQENADPIQENADPADPVHKIADPVQKNADPAEPVRKIAEPVQKIADPTRMHADPARTRKVLLRLRDPMQKPAGCPTIAPTQFSHPPNDPLCFRRMGPIHYTVVLPLVFQRILWYGLIRYTVAVLWKVGYGENRWSSTSGYIHVYSKLTKRAPEIMRMVLAHDLIDEVLSTLEALLSIPAPVLPAIHDCTRGCFILIIHAEPLHSNYGWLLDSLRSKLVQCLLRFAGRPLEGHDAEDGEDHSAHPALLGIIRILQRYVVHRPVLKLLGNIGRSQSVNSLRLQLPSDSRLRVEWTVFLAHVFELQKIQASFEQSEESKMKCFSYAMWSMPGSGLLLAVVPAGRLAEWESS
ncbi:hypothetical protein FPV67DRAFT_1456893 [Lyophyllum atratum]|nr:hypothetical protein FPV67DRAFT_1456893 [Lyophyllum atratum]